MKGATGGGGDWSTRVLVVCAVVVTALVLVREVRPLLVPGAAADSPQKMTQVEDWEKFEEIGRRIGPPNAPVVIVEFADLQCPVCRRFQESFNVARAKYGDSLALVFVHFPLARHRQAMPAARASECANNQGRFGEFVEIAYRDQEMLGTKPWWDFAKEAGVGDSSSFATCMLDNTAPELVRLGMEQGAELELRGTPTLLVNGWRYNGSLGPEALDIVIGEVLAGRRPPPG